MNAAIGSQLSLKAEQIYFFRHALLRDAAYQLQLPGDRARLHGLAFAMTAGRGLARMYTPRHITRGWGDPS